MTSKTPKQKSKPAAAPQPPPPPTTPLLLATPALASPALNYSYTIGRGETGVLTFEPYKSLLLPHWAFRTAPVARASARALATIFRSYVARRDFVGADMSRKFVQMGMTRARRYANHKGGRKYARDTGVELDRWTGGSEAEVAKRWEKEEASEVFKAVWRACVEDDEYKALKREWVEAKKEFTKANGRL